MKKVTVLLSMALAAAMSMAGFAGCNQKAAEKEENKQKTVMNVSLNPEVEFLLDVDGKVISVNALNEEGNLVISAEAFENVEGKTAEEAAQLFLQVTKDTGYLVEGNASVGDNTIDIAISGDTSAATELFNDVKAKMDEYLTAENVTASIEQAAAITEAQLKALVAECAPYVETAQMEYEQLLNTLETSRKETAEFYSQELKKAYYEAKAFAMKQAELETLRSHLGALQQLIFDGLNSAYTNAVTIIENTRMSMLVNENSIYQTALKAFREAKVEYLNYRKEVALGDAEISVEVTANLENLQKLVEDAETALLKAGEEANAALDQLKATVTENYNLVIAELEKHSVKANQHLEEISAKQQEKQAAFFAEFEQAYASVIQSSEKNWTDMESQLEKTAESSAQ